MKNSLLSTLLVLLTTMSSTFAEPDFESIIKKQASIKAKETFQHNFVTLNEQMKSSIKYIQGISVRFHSVEVTYNITNLTTNESIISDETLNIKPNDILDVGATYIKVSRVGVFDKYNMGQGGARVISEDDGLTIDIKDGLQESHGDMTIMNTGGTQTKELTHVFVEDSIRYSIQMFIASTHFGQIFSRVEDYQGPKGEIKITEDSRTINGASLNYEWLGPLPSRPPFMTYASYSITNNMFQAIDEIKSGDYKVSIENIFCGCNYPLEDDKVFDPIATNIHNYSLSTPRTTKLTGKILSQDEKHQALKGIPLKLVPACDDADKCMLEVEEVVTDENGDFKFKNVPKGKYHLVYINQKLDEVNNCPLSSSTQDIGTYTVLAPVVYQVDAMFKSKESWFVNSVHVRWKSMLIRPLNDSITPQEFLGQMGQDHWPIDEDGLRLTVPFVHAYGPLREISYGIDLIDDYNKPEFINFVPGIPGANCKVQEDDAAVNYLEFMYKPKPEPMPPFGTAKKGHHMSMSIDIFCEWINDFGELVSAQEFVSIGIPIGNGRQGVSRFNLDLMAEENLENMRKARDFKLNFNNSLGNTLKLEFKFMGYDTGSATDDDSTDEDDDWGDDW